MTTTTHISDTNEIIIGTYDIDHMADKMADQFISEGKCGDILDKN